LAGKLYGFATIRSFAANLPTSVALKNGTNALPCDFMIVGDQYPKHARSLLPPGNNAKMSVVDLAERSAVLSWLQTQRSRLPRICRPTRAGPEQPGQGTN
jgi:hypothetical protein